MFVSASAMGAPPVTLPQEGHHLTYRRCIQGDGLSFYSPNYIIIVYEHHRAIEALKSNISHFSCSHHPVGFGQVSAQSLVL